MCRWLLPSDKGATNHKKYWPHYLKKLEQWAGIYDWGYTYTQLTELWRAANATKSNLMMYWWNPEVLYQSFQGSNAEFQKVLLPPPTQECFENIIMMGLRCSQKLEERVGDPKGLCDESVRSLHTIMSPGLYNSIYDPLIPEALRNPGHLDLKLFSISELQLGELFYY
jgi:hypothetical protein